MRKNFQGGKNPIPQCGRVVDVGPPYRVVRLVCLWPLLFSGLLFSGLLFSGLLFSGLLFSGLVMADSRIHYSVAFEGLEKSNLEPLLREVSQCEKMHTMESPSSRFILLRRAKVDEKRLRQALYSRGYFAAKVTATVSSITPEQQMILVTFHVELGTAYHFANVTIQTVPKSDDSFVTPTSVVVDPIQGKPASARSILLAEGHLLREANKQGFAFAKLGKRHTRLDHDKQTLDVDLFLKTGEKITLGAVILQGSDGIASDYLLARVPWQPGTRYLPELLEEVRRVFMSTGLFSIVRVKIDPAPDALGNHPVTINLVQRKLRSISSGLGYGTSTGVKIAANWEHRNLLGTGEKLEIKGHAAMETLHLESSFSKPDFLGLQQKLLLAANLDQEESKAFQKDSFGVEGGLARFLLPDLEISYGLGYRLANVDDKSIDKKESFGLFSTPVKLTWDKRDHILDPSKGWYANLAGAGIVDTLGTGVWFGKFSGRYRRYDQLLENPQLVLAERIVVGTIQGSSQEDLPADERFFVGGAGSLRGYGFQMANNIGKDGKPIGGKSMLEFSVEARLQLGETISTVLFLDGGRAFADSVPNFDEELFLGPGIGLRYKTPVGPLRLDVGMPLHVRPGVDNTYQVYVSIGQAF